MPMTVGEGRSRILAVAATGLVALFGACSLPHDQAGGSADASTSPASTQDAGGSSSGSSSSGGGSGGGSSSGSAVSIGFTSACRAGFYQGTMTGSYFPDVDSGDARPIAGNVELTLDQQGTANQMCQIEVTGEGITTESCNQVFTISGGKIAGVLINPSDGAVGGLPYSCTVGGTLDCGKQQLDSGWIQCSYCDGTTPIDAGSCAAGSVVGFAGPLAADYDTSTFAFVNASWNGAEVLAGNSGGMPGPEGGPATDYLALDGGYGTGRYGGSGAWSAACLNCE
jgi:hypothetical protein